MVASVVAFGKSSLHVMSREASSRNAIRHCVSPSMVTCLQSP